MLSLAWYSGNLVTIIRKGMSWPEEVKSEVLNNLIRLLEERASFVIGEAGAGKLVTNGL